MAERQRIGVGVRGAGTVGGGVIRELMKHGPEWGLELRGVAVQNPLNPKREFQGPHYTTSRQLLHDPNIQIIVETPGGVHPEGSRNFMIDAMHEGMSVVTPAKGPVATYPEDLFSVAREEEVDFQFEGTVGGGIDVVSYLRDRTRVDRLSAIVGIVNGTTNHILTRMRDEGMSFGDALAEAQAARYAEADPTSDIEGMDAAYKLAILFMLGFNSIVDPENIDRRGITDISAEDFRFARHYSKEEGGPNHDIKLLAIAKRRDDGLFEARVTPALISRDNPLAAVNGVFNGVMFDWELAGRQMHTGRGAGRDATTAAVLSDIRRAAINLEKGPDELPTLLGNAMPMDPGDVEREGYLRSWIKDMPGTAGPQYTLYGDHGLNIGDIEQQRKYGREIDGVVYTPDIVTFRPIQARNIESAIQAAEQSGLVAEAPVFIPFEA